MYNAIQRNIEPELITTLKRYGMDLVIYNPIAGGLFSGKIKTTDIPAEGRFSDKSAAMGTVSVVGRRHALLTVSH